MLWIKTSITSVLIQINTLNEDINTNLDKDIKTNLKWKSNNGISTNIKSQKDIITNLNILFS